MYYAIAFLRRVEFFHNLGAWEPWDMRLIGCYDWGKRSFYTLAYTVSPLMYPRITWVQGDHNSPPLTPDSICDHFHSANLAAFCNPA